MKKVTVRATRPGDVDALLHLQTLWGNLIRQTEFDILAFRQACGFLFYFAQDVADHLALAITAAAVQAQHND